MSVTTAFSGSARRLIITVGLATAVTIPLAPASAQAHDTIAGRAVHTASNQQGDPYRWGAAGPDRFDCSGLTSYSYAKAGKRIPRTSQEQYRAARKVSQSSKRVGDLIFLKNSSGRVYHVGIYAGQGNWWVARRTGTTVTKQKIYTSNYSVGRVA